MDALLIDAANAAKRLGVSLSHFYSLRSKGLFGPAVHHLGGSVRFSVAEIADWIAAGSPSLQQWRAIKQGVKKGVDNGN